jgi:glycogen operon protein
VVFNHTAEGSELGPTVSLRGIDNAIYYWLDDKRFYRDFTGTGQTINAAHVVRDLILDALRYWVMEMHVDGFRFDLASVLGRDRDGTFWPTHLFWNVSRRIRSCAIRS